MSFARNIGNKYGKSMISSKTVRKMFDKSLDVGKSMKKKYCKKILDNSLSAGKDFAKIAGKKILTKSAEATGDLIEDTNDLDIVIPMYNLLEYNKNYRKTIGSLYNYYRDELSNL